MALVFIYSLFLFAGIVSSQIFSLEGTVAGLSLSFIIELCLMVCLSYIMIQVGREFRINFKDWKNYKKDCGVAALAALLPWFAVALYFLWILPNVFDPGMDGIAQALFLGRFAAPTSAGILFSMLAAAKLSKTWVFKKARIHAMLDDLYTVLKVLIPLQLVYNWKRPEVYLEIFIMILILWYAAKRENKIKWPTSPLWILLYSVFLAVFVDALHLFIGWALPIDGMHLAIFLVAFALGMTLYEKPSATCHDHDDIKHEPASVLISCAFMMLVGFSMPNFSQTLEYYSLTELLWHIFVITVLSNLFKCSSLFFYKSEASIKERLAISVAMFPRGQIGAAVIALLIGMGLPPGPILLATASLSVNLCMTGVFVYVVKRLIIKEGEELPKKGCR